jgi:hypothetical protein
MDLSACTDLRHALSRRRFLQIGPVGLLTAGLMQTIGQRAGAGQARKPGLPTAAGRRGTARACIVLFQVGGPYQCDTFDPKPLATE